MSAQVECRIAGCGWVGECDIIAECGRCGSNYVQIHHEQPLFSPSANNGSASEPEFTETEKALAAAKKEIQRLRSVVIDLHQNASNGAA